jgi:hypothetical protein
LRRSQRYDARLRLPAVGRALDAGGSSMHQQLRIVLGKASSTLDGSGAMAVVPIEVDPREIEQGALVRLLDVLQKGGYNLRIAGGCGIETGGEFVFAVEDEGNEDKASDCAAYLAKNDYEVRVVEPFVCEVVDEKGALRDCLAGLASDGRLINEVFVGTPNKDGRIPLQITTIRTVTGSAGGRQGRTRAS